MIWHCTRTKSNFGKKRFISSYSSKRDAVHKGWESSVHMREPKWGIVIIWTTTEGLCHSEWKEASSFHHNCICMLTLRSSKYRKLAASITTWSFTACYRQSGTGPSIPSRSLLSPHAHVWNEYRTLSLHSVLSRLYDCCLMISGYHFLIYTLFTASPQANYHRKACDLVIQTA